MEVFDVEQVDRVVISVMDNLSKYRSVPHVHEETQHLEHLRVGLDHLHNHVHLHLDLLLFSALPPRIKVHHIHSNCPITA